MSVKNSRKSLRISTWIVVLLVGLLVCQPGTHAGNEHTISLQAPPFLTSGLEESSPTSTSEIGALLDAEAGIAAYYKAPDAITLSQVRSQFRTIETETTNYIIGSVAVPNHVEHFDVHVYVNRNGWILAYYLRADPTSKILDVSAKTVNNTKLKTVVSIIAGAAGMPFSDVTYYDFRYPNATNMLLVAEDENDGRDFTIQLPSSYGYFERGWAAYDTEDEVDFYVDGYNLWNSATWTSNTTAYGYVTANQLPADTPHLFQVEDNGDDVYAVLVITYREP